MGLGMLIDGDALEVLPAPTTAHVGIALAIGGCILLGLGDRQLECFAVLAFDFPS